MARLKRLHPGLMKDCHLHQFTNARSKFVSCGRAAIS